jgi:hypothetical protein
MRTTPPTTTGCYRICDACDHMWHEPTRAAAARARKTARTATRAQLAEWTYDQALERFRQAFEDGFQDEQYALRERDWKWSKHELWRETVSPAGFRAFATASPEGASALIEKMIQTKAPMLHPQGEIVPLRDAINRPGNTPAYFSTLADLLEAPSLTPAVFDNYLQALTAWPLIGSGNLGKWTILTIVPFLAQPSRHMFLKPGRTKEITRRFGVDILYSSTPKWDTYERLLAFSNDLLEFLKPHGAQDMIDVQSFIWAITSSDDSAPA